jgi:hypothetical protein
MDIIGMIIDGFVDTILQGEAILELFDKYFTSQSESNRVLMLYGMVALGVLGGIELVKSILKSTAGIVKIGLVVGFGYYVIVVLLGIDLLGLFFG